MTQNDAPFSSMPGVNERSDPLILAAHGQDGIFREWMGTNLDHDLTLRVDQWREPNERHAYRRCGWCDSIHPVDLAGFVAAGRALNPALANMVYGWPHKLYCDLPNPAAGTWQPVAWEAVFDPDRNAWETIVMDSFLEPQTTTAKFYTTHLLNIPEESFDLLAAWIKDKIGVEFWRSGHGGELVWRIKPGNSILVNDRNPPSPPITSGPTRSPDKPG